MVNLKKVSLAASLALSCALASASVTPAMAGGGGSGGIPPSVITGGGGGSGASGWIIGGVFISVASIMACAAIIGFEEGRELTLEEAALSGLIPFGCLLAAEFGEEDDDG